MDTKKCLQCRKDYEPKKETSKFCSTSCRVMWNRKNGKKNGPPAVQTKVLYNLLIEKLSNVQFVPMTPVAYDAPKINNPIHDEPLSFDKLRKPYTKPSRSFDSYRQARTECECEEDWQALKLEIMNDAFLSQKQKNLLTS